LPAQDGHLMSQGDEFEFQRGTAAHPEQEQGPEGGQKRKNADDGMTAAPETLCFLSLSEFEQGQVADGVSVKPKISKDLT
jgi:hypothetical protein